MDFERDNQEQDWTPENDGQWTKEPAKRDPRFDFAAFLGPQNLEDRITDVLDGKDLMDEEAYGEYAPDYVPRRGAPGEHGRHEIPGSDAEDDDEPAEEAGEEEQSPAQPEEEMDFQQEPQAERPFFVDEPPPRPKVIVAEPAPRVYVDPQAEYGSGETPPVEDGGSSKGVKWLIAVLISAALVLGAVLLVGMFLPDIGGLLGLNGGPSPTPVTAQGGIPVRPTDAPAPVSTPEILPPEVKIFNISASASAGGSISPSGKVDVQEGGSVGFTFTPDEGYEISQILVDGAGGFVQTGYEFSDVRQDHTIYVEFRQIELPPPPEVEATDEPVPEPTAEPAVEPTAEPAPEPTAEPAPEPTAEPAPEPTAAPTEEPAPEPLPEEPAQGEPSYEGGEGQPAPPEAME